MQKPFYIFTTKWKHKGKVNTSYLYTITESSGLPGYVCFEHKRKTVQAKNKTEAQKKVVAIIRELQKVNHDSTGMTFGEYSKNYMVPGKCPILISKALEGIPTDESYRAEYRSVYEKHIEPDLQLCLTPLCEVHHGDIKRFRDRLANNIGVNTTVNKSLMIIKRILDHAESMGDLPFNPASHVKNIKVPKKPRGVITQEEARKLFPDWGIWPWSGELSYIAFLVAYTCGMRRGEVLGLRWKYVDLQAGVIHIEESYHYAIRKQGEPKHNKHRSVPVPRKTLAVLQEWKSRTRYGDPNDMVIAYQRGNMRRTAGENPRGSWWLLNFRKAMDNLGIDHRGRNITPHSLRHSINTHLQDLGYSREKLRETLGWSDNAIQDNYTHRDMMDHSGQTALVDKILQEKKDEHYS